MLNICLIFILFHWQLFQVHKVFKRILVWQFSTLSVPPHIWSGIPTKVVKYVWIMPFSLFQVYLLILHLSNSFFFKIYLSFGTRVLPLYQFPISHFQQELFISNADMHEFCCLNNAYCLFSPLLLIRLHTEI